MLSTELINPELMRVLSLCGHGDKILITDGNYPVASKSGNAEKIYLALTRDCPTVIQVLNALKTVVNFEKAELMSPGETVEPEIFNEFRKSLAGVDFEYHSRFEFYEKCEENNVKAAVYSGESRTYANILLTVGVA